jgi:hypothetical protein
MDTGGFDLVDGGILDSPPAKSPTCTINLGFAIAIVSKTSIHLPIE